MNSNRQTHLKGDGRKSPTKRGLWCFPYPHYDLFFCFHQWQKHLPKKFLKDDAIGVKHAGNPDFDTMTKEEAKTYWNEYEEKLLAIKKRIRPTTFWYNGEFYSHISPHGEIGGRSEWFWWDSARDWANVASKELYTTQMWNGQLYRFAYAKDHLEIFIPNY